MKRMVVKTYVVRGEALFNVSRYPTRQKFEKYVRALSEREAVEKVYAELGSKNKIKRYNIQIKSVEQTENIEDKAVRDLASIDRIILG